jgi:hypothetical protein
VVTEHSPPSSAQCSDEGGPIPLIPFLAVCYWRGGGGL